MDADASVAADSEIQGQIDAVDLSSGDGPEVELGDAARTNHEAWPSDDGEQVDMADEGPLGDGDSLDTGASLDATDDVQALLDSAVPEALPDHPVPCDNLKYSCYPQSPSPNPPPYEQCTGRYYNGCADGACIPTDGELLLMYRVWQEEAASLMGITPEVFLGHVFPAKITEQNAAIARVFRVTALVVIDWAIVEVQFEVRFKANEAVTADAIRFKLVWSQPAYSTQVEGVPLSIVALDTGLVGLKSCDPEMEPIICDLEFVTQFGPSKLGLRGLAYDPVAQLCRTAWVDLATGQLLTCTPPGPCALP